MCESRSTLRVSALACAARATTRALALRLMILRLMILGLMTLGLMTLAACGSDPTGLVRGGGTKSDSIQADAPSLPVPVGPLADVAATSDTLTVIRPLTGSFRPTVIRARADWELTARVCLFPTLASGFVCPSWGPTQALPEVLGAWSDEIPSVQAAGVEIPMNLDGPLGRLLLAFEGVPLTEVTSDSIFAAGRTGVWPYQTAVTLKGAALVGPVFVRRDRFWERQQLSSGVGGYLLVSGDTEATLVSTISSGTSESETSEFGRSVTASAGLALGPLSAAVSGVLSESHSASIEIREDRSESFSRSVRGSVGKQTRFMIWALVERYTFTDANGEPFTDPSFEMALDTLYRRGVATALQATEFPLGQQ